MVNAKRFGNRPVVDAKKRIYFEILRKHVVNAVRYDKKKCAIAGGCKDGFSDYGLVEVEIGANKSFFVFENKVVRYTTPRKLRDGLTNWDKTGDWDLPEGVYYLLPPTISAVTETRERYNRKRLAARKDWQGPRGERGYTPSPRHVAFLKAGNAK